MDIYDSVFEGLFYHDQATGVLIEYQLQCHQVRRADGRTTKDYTLNSILLKINGLSTGLSLTPFAPNNGLTAQQILIYSITGVMVVLIVVVVIAMVKAPSEKELNNEQGPKSNS